MSLTTLTELATEGSTYVINCTFTDEDGSTVTPQSNVAWRLLDSSGTQLSSGTESPAASVSIVLTDSDIVVSDNTRGFVFLTLVVSTTYNSDAGSGLSLVDTARFQAINVLDTP